MKLSSTALAVFMLGSALANPFAATTSNNAKSKYIANLMRGAKATPNSQLNRKLDQNEEYLVDISGYAVKFEQCQFVKTYSDEVAEDEDMDTVLETQRFAIFRLCPTRKFLWRYHHMRLVQLQLRRVPYRSRYLPCVHCGILPRRTGKHVPGMRRNVPAR